MVWVMMLVVLRLLSMYNKINMAIQQRSRGVDARLAKSRRHRGFVNSTWSVHMHSHMLTDGCIDSLGTHMHLKV